MHFSQWCQPPCWLKSVHADVKNGLLLGIIAQGRHEKLSIPVSGVFFHTVERKEERKEISFQFSLKVLCVGLNSCLWNR